MKNKTLKIKLGTQTYQITTSTPWLTQEILDIPSINQMVRNSINIKLRKEKLKELSKKYDS